MLAVIILIILMTCTELEYLEADRKSIIDLWLKNC